MRRLLLAATLALATGLAPTHAADLSQLQKIDHVAGTGVVAHNGDTVLVNYTGWLYDASAKDRHGKEFDSSLASGEPIRFTLGAGQVIAGWDQGIRGMHMGGKRTLVIPARLAYGSRGDGDDIPPDAVLIFDVELVGVR